MSSRPGILELLETDPSRFDVLDVARCVAKLGGSMRANQAAFATVEQARIALDVLSDRFGSRFFAPREPVSA